MKRILTLAAFGLLAFQSCTKDDDTTVDAQLTGNWRLSSTAVDVNNDGVIQASETTALDTGEYGSLDITNQTIKDSTYINGSGFSITYPYTRRNDTVFISGFVGSDPIFVIKRLTISNLDIMMPDSTSEEWSYYTRN